MCLHAFFNNLKPRLFLIGVVNLGATASASASVSASASAVAAAAAAATAAAPLSIGGYFSTTLVRRDDRDFLSDVRLSYGVWVTN